MLGALLGVQQRALAAGREPGGTVRPIGGPLPCTSNLQAHREQHPGGEVGVEGRSEAKEQLSTPAHPRAADRQWEGSCER